MGRQTRILPRDVVQLVERARPIIRLHPHARKCNPALPHGAMHDAVSSCGYTFLWNLLDYSAGILPVTKVDAEKDALSKHWKPSNGIEKGAYKYYDSVKMAGLPVAVQIVGRRLSEEKTLACMQVVEDCLRSDGIVYEHLDVENLPDLD